MSIARETAMLRAIRYAHLILRKAQCSQTKLELRNPTPNPPAIATVNLNLA